MNKIVRFLELSDLNKSSILLEMWDELEYVAENVYSARHGTSCFCHISVNSIKIEGGDEVVATFYWYDSTRESSMSGPDVYDEERFPISYLYEEGWFEKEQKAVQEKNLRAVKARTEKEEREKLKAAEAEKELFLRLKKKYEDPVVL